MPIIPRDLEESFFSVNLFEHPDDRLRDKILPGFTGKHPPPDFCSAQGVALIHCPVTGL